MKRTHKSKFRQTDNALDDVRRAYESVCVGLADTGVLLGDREGNVLV
ncbi:MAG TPA: hypothetical protein VEX40_05845 [Mycobacterium sp.]|nr:hypothetical protein [Mycobacterium sp.]